MIRKDRGILIGLLAVFLLSALPGCFDRSDKSWRKLRVFYSSDILGAIEPVG